MLTCILALALGSAIGFWLVSDASPVGPLPVLIAGHFAPGVVLQGIDVTEVFVSYLRVAVLVGFALALPVLIYQAIAFLAPALRPQEQRLLFGALPFLTELFLALPDRGTLRLVCHRAGGARFPDLVRDERAD